MKFTVLALGAAVAGISCVSPCSAQLNIESASAPQSRLASQNSEDGLDIFGHAPSSDDSSAAGDYFAGDRSTRGAGDPKSIITDQPSRFTTAIPRPAATQAPLGVLANTPEVGMVPVYWPDGIGGCPTPNPVADYMMRTWCTDGLWDTYAASRQCQCAHIQHHTGGYNRYSGGCSVCAPVQPWVTSPVTGLGSVPSQGPLAGCAMVPPKPVAQLVISPVMAAPTQLPTAQVAHAPGPLEFSVAPTQEAPAQQPPAQEDPVTPNALPAAPLPTDVPIVASRPTGLLR